MPTAAMYGIVIAYPFISVGILIIASQTTSIWRALINELKLWAGITILYIAIVFILLSLIRTGVPGWADLVAYTIFYFGLSLARKFWFTGSTDIFDKTKEVKLVEGKA